MTIKSRVRTVPHWPKPGVMFRDITTLLKDPVGLRMTINEFVNRYTDRGITKVAAVEARGFIIGAPLAYQLGVGFVPVRKQGKLPADTMGVDYSLEYGVDRVEIHVDAITEGDQVLIVDDLIATGGTALATCQLVRQAGGSIIECCFVVDLPDLKGMKRLEEAGFGAFALCEFEGE